MTNPFCNPSFIRVGFNALTEMFYIEAEWIGGGMTLTTGTAETTAGMLIANGVTHFDYKDDLFNYDGAFTPFVRAYDQLGAEHDAKVRAV